MSAVAGVAPRAAVPYRHVLHQHRAALITALVLAGTAAVLSAGGRMWSADGGWGLTAGKAVAGLLPLFGGVQMAGPMVAEELESGTYKMAWTQGVTPLRWLAAKAVVALGLLVGLEVALGWVNGTPLSFAPVPLAYVLLAVAFGTMVGLLVRRTTRATVVTGLALGVLMLAGQSQPHDTLGAQLTLALPLLAGTAVAAAAACLLLHRASQGDAS
ncbi:hypothetical protein ACIO3O_07140 [Streptomyces sp. NPDC087440]|uniref:hypothetical protein n=1 Tax=Streptomyces sp. NPDC087440 TaxID=3365790 RepID=UPI003830E4EA